MNGCNHGDSSVNHCCYLENIRNIFHILQEYFRAAVPSKNIVYQTLLQINIFSPRLPSCPSLSNSTTPERIQTWKRLTPDSFIYWHVSFPWNPDDLLESPLVISHYQKFKYFEKWTKFDKCIHNFEELWGKNVMFLASMGLKSRDFNFSFWHVT